MFNGTPGSPDFSKMTVDQIFQWVNEASWGQNSAVRGSAWKQVLTSLLEKIKSLEVSEGGEGVKNLSKDS